MKPTDLAKSTSVARVLLGPQTRAPRTSPDAESPLAATVKALRQEGRVALITAGWRERESEDAALLKELGGTESGDVSSDVVNLQLYHRRDLILDEDQELAAIDHQLHRQLNELQRLHRLRLDPTLATVRQLQRETPRNVDPNEELLCGERAAALAAVRDLDQHHLDTVARLRASQAKEWQESGHSTLDQHRQEVSAALDDCTVVVIAGGHVQALLKCLRTFNLEQRIATRPIVVWSAGAMALASTILLFHDRPPWGEGNAEVLDRGLGLLPGVLPLPHAHRRLRLEDKGRTALLARRMAPLTPITLDEGSHVELRSDGWWGSRTSVLQSSGERRVIGDVLQRVVDL